MLDGVFLERAGIPALTIVTEPFVVTAMEMARRWGAPCRLVQIPHPMANLTQQELDARADDLVERAYRVLKEPP